MLKQYWDVQHIRNGKVIWEMKHAKNAIANQGAEAILEYVYRSDLSYKPTIFYVRLCNYSPLVADDLTKIQLEPTQGLYGYNPQPITLDLTGFIAKDTAPDGNIRLKSAQVVFANTDLVGSIGPVTTAYIATTVNNTGKLWAYLPLAMTRTILAGDAMTYQFYAELGNA